MAGQRGNYLASTKMAQRWVARKAQGLVCRAGLELALLKFVPSGRHAAEAFDDFGQSVEDVVDVFAGVVDAEGEDDRPKGQGMIETELAQDGGDFEGMTDARGSTRKGNSPGVGQEHDAFAFDELNAEVEVGGEASGARRGTVEFDVWNLEAFPKFLLQAGGVIDSGLELSGGELGGQAGSDNGGDIFGPGPASAFLHAAVN